MTTPSTGGIKFFQHEQTTPSAAWTIVHGFGANPLVDANVNDAGTIKKAFPASVVYVDENTVTINWSSPRIGYASLASTQI